MAVEWIQREEPLKPVCRHCTIHRVVRHWSLWKTFFALDSLSWGFDHISCDRWWFISEPYLNREDVEGCSLVAKAVNGGCKVYAVFPGYHHEDVVTLIVVPSNVQRFIETVNSNLDAYNRYELWCKYQVDKNVVRQWIRKFSPPSEYECLRMALDYLTWRDKALH